MAIRKSIHRPETGHRWDSGRAEGRCGKQAPGTQGGRGGCGEKESPQTQKLYCESYFSVLEYPK